MSIRDNLFTKKNENQKQNEESNARSNSLANHQSMMSSNLFAKSGVSNPNAR